MTTIVEVIRVGREVGTDFFYLVNFVNLKKNTTFAPSI